MIIYAIYIIKNNGQPLISVIFQSDIPNENLLASLILALKSFAEEIFHKAIISISVEDVTYHIKDYGSISIVVVTNNNERPKRFMTKIGLRFLRDYGMDLLDNTIRVDKFLPFKKTIKEIINQYPYDYDESSNLDSSKNLNPIQIFSLPTDLQNLALNLLSLKNGGTIDDINEACEGKIDNIDVKLETLQKLGFIGFKTQNNQRTFFYINRDNE